MFKVSLAELCVIRFVLGLDQIPKPEMPDKVVEVRARTQSERE